MRIAWTIVVGCLMLGSAAAVTPRIWVQDTQDAFLKGEVDGVSISREGSVTLGPRVETFGETGESFVWSLARHESTVYAGTGNEGRIYKISPDGTADLLFDSPEIGIFSLAVGSNGTVYAGSSPDGLIYAIAPGKEPQTLARTGDHHVWALSLAKGKIYAATGGQQGKVVAVSLDGTVETVLEVADANVVSLLCASDGRIYAGTDTNGLIYLVEGGRGRVLYDAAEAEIHALALASDGTLYATAMSTGARAPAPPRANEGGDVRGQSKRGERSMLYAIQPSGSGYRLWESKSAMMLSVEAMDDGSARVLTSHPAGIYAVYPHGGQALTARLHDAQPWVFAADGSGGGWLGAASSGTVWRLGSDTGSKGTLTSPVKDFNLVSRWGRLDTQVEVSTQTQVRVDTRSGNREEPDETWSGWAVTEGGQIQSPPARFIQVRATLTGDGKSTPVLRSTSVAGLHENVQPMILTLTVSPPGVGFNGEAQAQGNKNGRRGGSGETESGVWQIEWSGADVNNDELVYALHFKGRSERDWKLLAEDLTGTNYVWNTESAPEGTMQVRLTVSDRLSNPDRLARTSERLSKPFDVDHTPPVVRLGRVTPGSGSARVDGTITDATTPIREAAYSLNSGPWTVVFPDDDIFDAREESFTLSLDDLSAGEYTFVIRALDGLGNVGVAKKVFIIK